MWEIKVSHDGLNKFRTFRGNDKDILNQKADAQIAAWDEMWQKKLDKEEARSRTEEASDNIKDLENTLQQTLDVDCMSLWETLKDHSTYPNARPQKPQLENIPQPPRDTEYKYQPCLGFLDKLISSRKEGKIKRARELYKTDYLEWEKKKKEILKKNAAKEKQFQNTLKLWYVKKLLFLAKKRDINKAIDKRIEQYFGRNPDAIVDYCELVLSNSQYPDYFPKRFDLEYNPTTKILIVDYSLPSVDQMPRVKNVKYVKSRGALVESYLSESTINNLYDSLVYQITLRTISELYQADAAKALESIVFNGWVESIEKAIGNQVNICILSVQANRAEFLSINLNNVDPKLCFKKLKGVGSSKLHSLTPIAPVLRISREDTRFISSYGVADELDESINLAAMDWEDFEHLIRELFEKEFQTTGGEVKVTQDGGVDAIAFDPDPIRGGKIVIQAKRYTNTVGVSAVRDLYDTVVNEGATKGILVTTADYGADAYEFAKGKPLTLLCGSNLLHLLGKHGHHARIDLKLTEKNK